MSEAPNALKWIGRFARVSPGAGAHLAIRYLGFRHFDRLEHALPPAGRILDVGCGHGLLAILAAARQPAREVVGIDLAASRLEIARRVAARHEVGNVRFEQRRIDEPSGGVFDAIMFVDVLMYLPMESQRALVEQSAKVLAPGGVLLVKEQVRSPPWKARLVALQESLAYGARVRLGLWPDWGKVVTPAVYLWDAADFEALLRSMGLHVRSEPLDRWSYLSHRLFVARSP